MRQAVNLNPNHVGANQLLADILLAQGQAGNAREILERLYKYQPAAARSRLIQALLALAQSNDNENEQLKFYEQVLGLDAEQPEAKSGRLDIWQRRGDEAHKAGDLETALAAFRTAHLDDKVAEVEREIRDREFKARLKALNEAEQAKQQSVEKLTECRQHEKDLEKAVSQYQQQVASLKNELAAKKKALQKAKGDLQHDWYWSSSTRTARPTHGT
ncbi:MAG: hypothetical protein ABFS56_03965 [Pseudomonadota bacterium]